MRHALCLWGSLALLGCGGTDHRSGDAEDAGAAGDAGEGTDTGRPACCVSDADCDDGLHCNGVERCDDACACRPGTAVACDDGIACTVDGCSEETRACTATGPDADGDEHGDAACLGADGAPAGDDCDDADATRHP